MRKFYIILISIAFSINALAQQKIQLRSVDKAECVSSDFQKLRASFSFSTIDVENIDTQRGQFSWISMPNTVIGGNEGDPQIPVVNKLIAVPLGANPTITVTSHSSTDYKLNELGIQTLIPRQPAQRKDQQAVPFVYNETTYQTRGLRSQPQAQVSVDGTMRGVQIGRLSIEPVSYDPVSNTLRVFNDIEVEVSFNGADTRATEDMLVKTYSPYFDVLYKQLFNSRAILDVYDEHPDLWKSPVKMLVIANRMFENCIQDWVAWKTTKGIYVDLNYTDNIGTSVSAIKSFIQTKYAEDTPTFLVIMGDKAQVAPSITSASETSCVSDLDYSSVDGDQFVDMYHSRISAETTAEMTAILNKALEYEQYTMPDPSYLNNVLLIAGEDDGWGVTVGRPTIWYASNYYFNAEHGYDNVYEFSHGTYTNCYSYLSTGVGFANYTAHGSKTSWAGPSFSVSDVANLTNTHKYFFAIGNCCQSGDWGYSTTCFGEALVRAENKGAFAYIGSCPNTVWLNDYYFGVGPTSRADGTMPSMSETGTGIYDALWMDDVYNTVNSILYVGDLAGNAAQALGYTMHEDPLYYWQAYHVIGDGTIMPYRVQPTANSISHSTSLPMGVSTFAVSAVPGSYVAISQNGTLLGTALVGTTGTVNVPITPVTTAGEVTLCVTAPQRIPYLTTIPIAALDGAYISVDSYTPNLALIGETTDLSITFKNVGNAATTGSTTVTLTAGSSDITVVTRMKSFSALDANASTTVSGFRFRINSSATLGTPVSIHYKAVNSGNTWEGDITITPNQIFTVTANANNANYGTISGSGNYNYGESCTVTATPADGYMFTNWTQNGSVVSTNESYTFNVTSNVNLVANFVESVVIGDSGTTNNDFLPSYNYYNNSLSEQIYTSDEMGGAGVITSIAFYNGGAEKTLDYEFYMKATTKSSFSSKTDWIMVSANDKVFSGSVTMVANDWTTITFSDPFVYDGTSNVVLVTDKSTQWTNSPHMSCRVFSTNSSQAIYTYDDNVDFDPTTLSWSSANSNNILSVKNQIILSKEAPSDCMKPTQLTATEIGPDFVKLSWTENGSSDQWVVDFGYRHVTANTNNNFIVDGLTPETDYTIMVRPTCDESLYSSPITITTLEACPVPQNLEVSNTTLNWNGYSDSYNVQLGVPSIIISENFNNGIPSDWSNNSSYPWTIVDGHLQSSNAGVASSTSSISVEVTYPDEGTISFDFWSRGEGNDSNDWDKCRFYIDDEKMFDYGAHSAWESYSNTVSAGTHTFKWEYKKDSSVNPDGDCFIVDNVEMKSGETIWNAPIAVENTSYTFTGLTSFTTYCVRVQGVCDNTETEWSELATFTTGETPSFTQTVEFGEGWNWWSPIVNITLEELEAALGSNGISIISQDSAYATYNNNWGGNLTSITAGQMYMIQTTAACTINLTGEIIDPSDVTITLNPGSNWISFIGTDSMTLEEALENLTPTHLDIIKTANGTAVYYQNIGWKGNIDLLTPGQGFIYKSKSSTSNTFIFPSAKQH